MSEKNNKFYRYICKNLEREALEHYEYLSFFQKLKYKFNKNKYVNGILKRISSIILI